MHHRIMLLTYITLILLRAPVLAQYAWTPSVQLVDNTTWCESNNCYTSIGGSENVLSAGYDGTVYANNYVSGSSHVISRWTQSGGWAQAPSGLQTAGGLPLTLLSVASATQIAALTNAAYPTPNVYLLDSAGTGWTGPLGTGVVFQGFHCG